MSSFGKKKKDGEFVLSFRYLWNFQTYPFFLEIGRGVRVISTHFEMISLAMVFESVGMNEISRRIHCGKRRGQGIKATLSTPGSCRED